jgi:D-serine dehydratase
LGRFAATGIDQARIAALADEPLDWRYKSLPAPCRLGDVADQGWHALAGDLPMPVMVIREAAVARNLATMADWCAARGVLLAPHGKTTMAPQLFARQVDAGAWAMTCATPWHLAVYRRFGVERVVYANEIVEPAAARLVADEQRRDPRFELYCLVDSEQGVDLLDRLLADAGATRPVFTLVEIGHDGGRCGARSAPLAERVADRVLAAPRLRLAGVEAFEGLRRLDDPVSARRDVDAFLELVVDAFTRIAPRIDDEPVLTAGGSAFFDQVVDAFAGRGRVVIRSGCYITHDGGMYDRVSPLGRHGSGMLENALEVWGAVVSRPEPSLAIATFGRRDVPFDAGYPTVAWRYDTTRRAAFDGASVVALSDQHAHIQLATDTPLRHGDLVGATISHPCGAFDRWRVLFVVDHDDRVIDAVLTVF